MAKRVGKRRNDVFQLFPIDKTPLLLLYYCPWPWHRPSREGGAGAVHVMADAQEPISYTQRGTIAKGDLVLAPVELLPAEWRSWRGISTTLEYVRRAATVSPPSRSPKRGGVGAVRNSERFCEYEALKTQIGRGQSKWGVWRNYYSLVARCHLSYWLFLIGPSWILYLSIFLFSLSLLVAFLVRR